MEKTESNYENQNNNSGEKGEKGIISGSGYEKLWDKLREDIGLINIILTFLGSILLIFSPEKGWEFDIPCINYTLAYRGWLGILCFIIVLISKCINKKRKVSSSIAKTIINPDQIRTETEAISPKTILHNGSKYKSGVPIKSMYVHFSKDNYNDLFSMTTQLSLCNDHSSAMLLLLNYQKLFNGKLYFSPFPQNFAIKKLIATKGENEKEWCWWRWEGGNEGFQLIVSLCQ